MREEVCGLLRVEPQIKELSRGGIRLDLACHHVRIDASGKGPCGTFNFSPNLTNLPQNATFMIGETWDFQAWYRDGAASTSNFTDGIEVMFR